ncbi:hypothetical protein MNEG_7579, partial [Monoraphidium neglectum]
MADLLEPTYWCRLAAAAGAGLHCDNAAAKAAAAPVKLPRARKADLRRQIDHAG